MASREGRFGFPRPFGDVLSQYRPLVESDPRTPRNVRAIAEAMEDNGALNTSVIPDEEQFIIEFMLNVEDVDTFSKSTLYFNEEGQHLGGTIRTSTFDIERDEKSEFRRDFEDYLTEKVGLDFSEDDISVLMRDNIQPGGGFQATPHIVFSFRNFRNRPNTSPVTTPELLVILDEITSSFDREFAEYETTERSML